MMSTYVARKPQVRLNSIVRRLRAFPALGEPEVGLGAEVQWDTRLGQYASRQRLRFVRVESTGDRIAATVLVGQGQKVKRGEVLAYYSFLFGLGFTEYTSPCDGEIVEVNQVLSSIAIKEAPVPLHANLTGKVVEIDEALGVFVESKGDLVYGVAGSGYGRSGILETKIRTPGGEVKPSDLSAKDAGKVIVAGKVTQELLEACLRWRVAGLVAGSVPYLVYRWYKDVSEKLEWDEFLATYWARELKEKGSKVPPPMEIATALVVTDGFGDMPMNAVAFAALCGHSGERVFLDGGGAFRSQAAGADETLPCVFIPGAAAAAQDPRWELAAVAPGDRVRVLGLIEAPVEATVLEIDEEGGALPTGMPVPSAKVETADGKSHWVPLLNLEKVG